LVESRYNFKLGRKSQVFGAPEGVDALVLAEITGKSAEGKKVAPQDVLFIARDDLRMERMAAALSFFAPDLALFDFPAWDCLPYDRVSPNGGLVGRRIDTLTRLQEEKGGAGRVVLTTVSAFLQKVVPRSAFSGALFHMSPGDHLSFSGLVEKLVSKGYGRSDTVMEPGEFALRGGLLDFFPPGMENPLRLDFFGDTLESIRSFDAADQITTQSLQAAVLTPVSEVPFNEEAIACFRSSYRALFGAASSEDPLYGAVSAGRRQMGVEHWLGLFYPALETLLDYLPHALVVLDHQAEEARDARLDLIAEYYAARLDTKGSGAIPYNPVPPEKLYLSQEDWDKFLEKHPLASLSPFAATSGSGALDAGGRLGRDFADIRVRPDASLFDVVCSHLEDERKEQNRKTIISCVTEGSRQRLGLLFKEHGLENQAFVETWDEAEALPSGALALAVIGVDKGFVAPGITVVSERDILGERLTRSARAKGKIRPENLIAEASALSKNDLVVHAEHGIARYEGLETLKAGGAPHDCLRLVYAGGDKLFLPVENIEVISRYGSEHGTAQLDRLGGAAWQARKAQLKKRVREMADELIKVAAARSLRQGEAMQAPEGAFDEFCARFPYSETEDQIRAINETLEGLASGTPMDRLICGDVGFGKTEVALRAAFVAALNGYQVAIVVPTTLLCRQHYQVFKERFQGFPVRVEQLSRLVTSKQAKAVKAGLADGTLDIVMGTHALLAKDVRFRNLGLLVVDEEQHFGVTHKEKLKKIKADVHVLTLTATPIPRTLQLALSGVREMSLIATPPVDRLAVRTFILPYDPVVLREAIMRERFRGGQTFYVCPRIADLEGVKKRLRELVPEISLAVVHGKIPPKEMENIVSDFYDRKYDLLLSTNIIESGLDLPAVNTIFIHRADHFGLAQLYQLRGRVGRSKTRAYAYLTLPVRKTLSTAAEKRLSVMQTLDTLGAGFSLASHDLDIRGAGNLLGGEQSGHIREVGVELYQKMLEEAVSEARGLEGEGVGGPAWTPEISIGIPVLIPETYIGDLNLRMTLYRRIAALSEAAEIEPFAAELIDRFGTLPEEVENLLKTIAIKRMCQDAGIGKIEAGPKGAIISFHDDAFANPAGLVAFLSGQARTVILRPDHKLVYKRAWGDPESRLSGVQHLVENLASIAKAEAA
jgi:transcription-repair coupling factor (superfamily II helicase)